MAIKVNLRDHSKIVLDKVDGNVNAALHAIGIKAVNLILYQMRRGYGKPIRDTGNLQRDVQYEVNTSMHTVKVGNTLEYAPFVHDGTYKMPGRPYINDSISKTRAGPQFRKVAEENLKNGF